MPRNEAKPLSGIEFARQKVNTAILARAMDEGREVTVSYSKRDGSESSSHGTVEFFNGRPGHDTGSVTIADPVKGNRTINLHRIFRIE